MESRSPSALCAALLALASPAVAGPSVGRTLLESPSARSAAMGDAVGADRRDIAVLAFNPAGLTALDSTQISLLYQRGLADDGYAAAMFGHDFRRAAVGFSAGFYDGGEAILYDGVAERTVNAQRDLSACLGVAVPRGALSFGASAKYLSSELAEAASGSAFAFDAGLRADFPRRISLGAAAQNFGGKVTYLRARHPLPRLVRTSAAWEFGSWAAGGTVVADVRHLTEDRETEPAAGLELWSGPLALRAGYRFSERADALSAGAGLTFGKMSFDYAFGLASQLEDRHRASVTMIFGGEKR